MIFLALAIGVIPLIAFAFWLTNENRFGWALISVLAYLALTLVVITKAEPGWEKDRREVKEQIEACVAAGNTPIFALDDNTAEFFDCQEGK